MAFSAALALILTDARKHVQNRPGSFLRLREISIQTSSQMLQSIRSKVRNRSFQLRLLIVAAAIWHVAVTGAVYTVGKSQLAPNQIYPSGIGRFAFDGVRYQQECVELSDVLKNVGLRAWAGWPTQLHVRLYSLPFSFISGSSFNILTIEPLNLAYYLCILTMVFLIGKYLFGYSSGLLAAAVVGLWPSLLLHTTQLLRDPLLLCAVLLMCLSIVVLLERPLTWWRAGLFAFVTATSLVLIRIVRLPMWRLSVALVIAGIALLFVRVLHNRTLVIGAVIFALLAGAAILTIPRFQNSFRNQQHVKIQLIDPTKLEALSTNDQIVARRGGFKFRMDEEGKALPADDGSRIDKDIQFHSVGDILKYLPRAVIIGFFAPFPNMWFNSGKQVGTSGRWLSGFEMTLTYVLECFALIGLWKARKQLAAWFLFAMAALGIVALGLVVNNIGALYRLRYPFWIVIVILGSGGLVHLYRDRFVRRESVS